MILTFPKNKGYEELILNGIKKISIREDKSDRWKVGNKIQFSTGVRTKEYNCFKEGQVKRIDFIEIKDKKVYVNNILLNLEGLKNLAQLDGYKDMKDFFDFFGNNYKGKIIWW
jgi:uncharacterized protein YqfB (UPF0267 family)